MHVAQSPAAFLRIIKIMTLPVFKIRFDLYKILNFMHIINILHVIFTSGSTYTLYIKR